MAAARLRNVVALLLLQQQHQVQPQSKQLQQLRQRHQRQHLLQQVQPFRVQLPHNLLLNAVAGVLQGKFCAQLDVSMTVQIVLVILLVNALHQQRLLLPLQQLHQLQQVFHQLQY